MASVFKKLVFPALILVGFITLALLILLDESGLLLAQAPHWAPFGDSLFLQAYIYWLEVYHLLCLNKTSYSILMLLLSL